MRIMQVAGIATILLGLLSLSAFSVLAADQVKSTDLLVTTSEIAVSSATTSTFTLYVGDNLAGVSSPVKSLYFVVSGVYTGGGTAAIALNADSATTKTFTLPTVSSPTPFEFLYKDPTNSIAPTSAGSYSYTLTTTPSGVTLFGLAVKMSETHRFVPASCADGSSANEKVKTNEFLVAYRDTALSAATTTGFSFYIGDNLSGISTPLKSLEFVASGVYTGSGTLALSLNGDSATTKTFTLPSVSTPTHFDLIYKDPTNSISPTSAGTYSHTLTATPSGVTLYGFNVELHETHRYKPPTCGGMPVKGELYSAVFETTSTSTGPSYNAILWKGALGGPSTNQGHVRFQLAASDCANGATNYPTCSTGTWAFVGGATCSSVDWFDPGAADTSVDLQSSSCIAEWSNKRYFRYAVEICSDDCTSAGSYTPRVDDIIVNWSP